MDKSFSPARERNFRKWYVVPTSLLPARVVISTQAHLFISIDTVLYHSSRPWKTPLQDIRTTIYRLWLFTPFKTRRLSLFLICRLTRYHGNSAWRHQFSYSRLSLLWYRVADIWFEVLCYIKFEGCRLRRRDAFIQGDTTRHVTAQSHLNPVWRLT